jgi:hypothetical protein
MEALLCKIFFVGEHIHVCLSSHEIATAWSELIFGDWQLQATSSLLAECVTRHSNLIRRTGATHSLSLCCCTSLLRHQKKRTQPTHPWSRYTVKSNSVWKLSRQSATRWYCGMLKLLRFLSLHQGGGGGVQRDAVYLG